MTAGSLTNRRYKPKITVAARNQVGMQVLIGRENAPENGQMRNGIGGTEADLAHLQAKDDENDLFCILVVRFHFQCIQCERRECRGKGTDRYPAWVNLDQNSRWRSAVLPITSVEAGCKAATRLLDPCDT